MYSAIAANKRNTLLIMAIFVVIIGALGWFGAYWYDSMSIFYTALITAAVYAFIQYFLASRIALAVNGAREITKQDNPKLWRTVENLCIATGLPMPKVYIIDDPAPNAFATGRDPHHASVAATSGLINMMTDSELQGVIAHELGHVQNYDIRVSMIVFGMVSAIGFLADILLRMFWFGDDRREARSPILMFLGIAAAVLAPVVALLVQLAISRQREYLADSTGALTTRYPDALASALQKIAQSGSAMHRQNTSTAHLFFANPLKGKSFAGLFDTHPPIEKRIERLRTMGDKV